MVGDQAAAASQSHTPRWWRVVGSAASATVVASMVVRAVGAAGPGLTSSLDLNWLLAIAALLVPAWWLWSSARAARLLAALAKGRVRRVVVSLGLSLAALVNLLAVAFAVFLWRGQVAYSREHDPLRLPPGANAVTLSALAPLEDLTPDEHLRLRTYLARNYRWFVTTWDGERVAFLRGGAPGARVHGSNGYQQSRPDGDGVQSRLGIFLDTASPAPSRVPIDTVEAGTPLATVRLLHPPQPVVRYNSRLWIGGRMVGVEVFEESARPERVTSDALVAALGDELARLLGATGVPELDDMLEAGSLGSEHAEGLTIGVAENLGDEDDLGHGVYVVGGAVNPGEEGHVSLRAFDAATNRPLGVTALPAAQEFVGWSADASRRYRYGFEVIVEDREERDRVTARFELWFTPAADGTPRRLLSVDRVIRGYRY